MSDIMMNDPHAIAMAEAARLGAKRVDLSAGDCRGAYDRGMDALRAIGATATEPQDTIAASREYIANGGRLLDVAEARAYVAAKKDGTPGAEPAALPYPETATIEDWINASVEDHHGTRAEADPLLAELATLRTSHALLVRLGEVALERQRTNRKLETAIGGPEDQTACDADWAAHLALIELGREVHRYAMSLHVEGGALAGAVESTTGGDPAGDNR